MRKPSLLTGALVGGLVTLPFIALSAAGSAIAGFPFLPFDLFDWLVVVLPAEIINVGKGIMVDIIVGLGIGRLDSTAKLAEQAMGVGIDLGLGIIAGAVFFAILNRSKRRFGTPAGVLLGLIAGIPMFAISSAVNFNTAANPLVVAVWVLGLLVLWGVCISYVYDALRYRAAAPSQPSSAAPWVVTPVDRRTFLIQLGAASAAVTVVGTGISALLNRPSAAESVADASLADGGAALPGGLPNANDPVLPVPGTRLEVTPVENHYRIDIRSTPLDIPSDGYTLPFTYTASPGDRQILKEFTLDEIRALPAADAYITMSCISNPIAGDLISTTRWTGVSMQRLLQEINVPPNAKFLKISAGDDFDETIALDLIASDERIMLAYDWDGKPLPARHGYPLRIHIPDRYGMKQPKWITHMQFIDHDEDGYWVRRGWDKEALVRATSVIDTVHLEDAESGVVSIGGIAWSGARGVSAVEVRMDDGEWQPAQLRSPISDRTWQIWRYDWQFTEGAHTFAVRCFEGDGTPQIETRAGVQPSGATGIHSVRRTL